MLKTTRNKFLQSKKFVGTICHMTNSSVKKLPGTQDGQKMLISSYCFTNLACFFIEQSVRWHTYGIQQYQSKSRVYTTSDGQSYHRKRLFAMCAFQIRLLDDCYKLSVFHSSLVYSDCSITIEKKNDLIKQNPKSDLM